jgi:hypothetical protein
MADGRPAVTRRWSITLWSALFGALAFGRSSTCACPVQWLGGDAIGPNATFTSNTGGFTAVRSPAESLGQPALLVAAPAGRRLSELRAVVFGIPPAEGVLRFDRFDYQLDIWPAENYFAGEEPMARLALGAATNVTLVENQRGDIVPATTFGSAGSAGGYAPTYELRFSLEASGFSLEPGSWVFGFQSWHDPAAYGSLRLAGSKAIGTSIPLFSREGGASRGVLGGQDPASLKVTWGLAVGTRPTPQSSRFGEQRAAPAAALGWWQQDFGAACSAASLEGDLNNDFRVDGADLLLWQRIVDTALDQGSTAPVPEPTEGALAAAALWAVARSVRRKAPFRSSLQRGAVRQSGVRRRIGWRGERG